MPLINVVKDTPDDVLLQLLNNFNSVQGVVGYFAGGKQNEQIRYHISERARQLGWRRVPNLSKNYSVDDVISAFSAAGCWSDIYRVLGLTICDHNKKGIIRFANHHNIPVPTFTKEDLRKAYQRGKGNCWDEDSIFCVDSIYPRSGLRGAALRFNVSDSSKCTKCGILPEWSGQPLTLELDHINGVHNDNRKENLRWLCPNCHSQTHTFKGKNR